VDAQRPKPDPKDTSTNGRYLKWLERMLGSSLNGRTLAEFVASVFGSHAPSHVDGGSDEIAGEDLAIAFTPANYTPTGGTLAGQLEGIDAALGALGGVVTTYTGRMTSSATGQSANTTVYLAPIGMAPENPATTLVNAQMLWGRAGTIRNLRVRNLSSSGDAGTVSVYVNVNGSNTALGITGIAGTDTAQKRNTSDTATVAVEDLLVIAKVTPVGTAASTHDMVWSFDFEEAA
jgi:hypothetical protein